MRLRWNPGKLSLALTVCALLAGGWRIAGRSGASKGFRVYVAVHSEGLCGDNDGSLVLQVGRGGQVLVNGVPVTTQIYAMVAARHEGGLFVMPDPDVDFGSVAAAIEMESIQVERIALLTSALNKSVGCRPSFPWPKPGNPMDRYVKPVRLWPY